MEAVLLLEDGKTFYGEGFGAEGTVVGEVVFNTAMTGYQEVITDPSYKGQMVTMTYPHIGNYGINDEDIESGKPQIEALIVRELCKVPSNYRSQESLDHYLKRHSVQGIHQIDTRELTRYIREKGSMMGILSTEGLSIEELSRRVKESPSIVGRDLVQFVTQEKQEKWKTDVESSWYYDSTRPLGDKRFQVVAYDFGIKFNICRLLYSLGIDINVVPASTTAEEIREMKPDGLFLSNGPGDPEGVAYVIENVRKLLDHFPIFGICLGNQIISLAFGIKTYKMKFGHHGSNHPVMCLETGEIEITAQNHNFAVDAQKLDRAGLIVTHRNLNDDTVEGIAHRELPLFSVQYHPEASPGPHDSLYLFKQFYTLMDNQTKD
jgi:carbamoyl-phosphate synthase small subunit